ncbi:MAG: BON domain-containing protein [Candidatus Limnocylindria bacterium]
MGYVLAALAGAVLAFFLDPDRGKRRRLQTVDRARGVIRRVAERTGRGARFTTAQAYGIAQKAAHVGGHDGEPANDATLAQKVMSELFRDPDIPKGDINVNVARGVVYLRGEVEHPEDIRRIEASVRAIVGVRDVENLLHLPKTAARRPDPAGPVL